GDRVLPVDQLRRGPAAGGARRAAPRARAARPGGCVHPAPAGAGLDGAANMTAMHEVKLSSRDRVLFPEDGITKGDLFDYYDAVADAIVPHLRDRPFTMKRWREGLEGGAFFQKQAPKGIPQ